jgi:hypothetical protein
MIGHHDNPGDLGGAFAYRFEDCDTLGAHAQTISRVLDVASGEYAAVGAKQRRAHTEVGIGSVSPVARLLCQIYHFINTDHFNYFPSRGAS